MCCERKVIAVEMVNEFFCSEESFVNFEKKINNLIEDGYQPHGEVQYKHGQLFIMMFLYK